MCTCREEEVGKRRGKNHHAYQSTQLKLSTASFLPSSSLVLFSQRQQSLNMVVFLILIPFLLYMDWLRQGQLRPLRLASSFLIYQGHRRVFLWLRGDQSGFGEEGVRSGRKWWAISGRPEGRREFGGSWRRKREARRDGIDLVWDVEHRAEGEGLRIRIPGVYKKEGRRLVSLAFA
jgi:hypothetical protein